VIPETFSLIEGKHYFFSACGIHPFCNPSSAPGMYSINLRRLDDFHLETENHEIVEIDGRNWDETVIKLNEQFNFNPKIVPMTAKLINLLWCDEIMHMSAVTWIPNYV
jgi:hypothetical protein